METQAREYAHTATEKLLATGGMVVYDKRNPLHYTAFVLRKVGRLTAQQVQNYIEEKQLAQKPSDIFAETTQSDFLKVMASVMNFQQI